MSTNSEKDMRSILQSVFQPVVASAEFKSAVISGLKCKCSSQLRLGTEVITRKMQVGQMTNSRLFTDAALMSKTRLCLRGEPSAKPALANT